LEVAQSRLGEIIAELGSNDEVVIVSNQTPLAKLSVPHTPATPRFGNCRGMLTIVAEDDEHLKDFAEYK
jgi:hypothetical protein